MSFSKEQGGPLKKYSGPAVNSGVKVHHLSSNYKEFFYLKNNINIRMAVEDYL